MEQVAVAISHSSFNSTLSSRGTTSLSSITSLVLQIFKMLLTAPAMAFGALLIKHPVAGTTLIIASFILLILKLHRANARAQKAEASLHTAIQRSNAATEICVQKTTNCAQGDETSLKSANEALLPDLTDEEIARRALMLSKQAQKDKNAAILKLQEVEAQLRAVTAELTLTKAHLKDADAALKMLPAIQKEFDLYRTAYKSLCDMRQGGDQEGVKKIPKKKQSTHHPIPPKAK